MIDWRSVEGDTETNFEGSEDCSSLMVTTCVSNSSIWAVMSGGIEDDVSNGLIDDSKVDSVADADVLAGISVADFVVLDN